jgi:hypothetical protein
MRCATCWAAARFRSVNTYPHLVGQQIAGNPESLSDADLAEASRRILDDLFRSELGALHRLFETRAGQGRTTTDVAQAARAATFGAVETLLVDIDAVVPGTVDDEGRVEFDDAPSARTCGVIDQTVAGAFLAGARVLGVRRDDLPGGGSVAAILRYPF